MPQRLHAFTLERSICGTPIWNFLRHPSGTLNFELVHSFFLIYETLDLLTNSME